MYDVEEWREVPGFDGWYDVSDRGRVRSWRGNWRGSAEARSDEPRILVPYANRKGYLLVALYLPGAGRSTVLVHRAVALAFIGPCPEGMQVCHNNGDPSDNTPSNLRYDTQAANLAERIMPRGEQNHNSKLSVPDVHEIRRLRDGGWKLREIGAKFGVCEATVHNICVRKKWAHI